MLFAFQVFDPGTLGGVLSPILIVVAVWLAARAYSRVNLTKAQAQAIETWEANAEGANTRAMALQAERDEQRALKHTALTELAAERLKTDLTGVLAQLTAIAASQAETSDRVESGLKLMEERLVAQLARQTEALDLIVKNLVKVNGNSH